MGDAKFLRAPSKLHEQASPQCGAKRIEHPTYRGPC